MKKEIDAVLKAHEKYEGHFFKLEVKIKEVCEFEAYLTWCAGDGHLVGNADNSSVAPLFCLKGKNKRNKLTAEDHLLDCI